MNKKAPLFIKAKDVQYILGCGSTTAHKRLALMKVVYSKQAHQSITLQEFADYEGVPISDIINYFVS